MRQPLPSFEELVLQNKQEILKDKREMEKIEAELDEKQVQNARENKTIN
ncbi:FbpB family small basic protein [Thalassobacillus sp. CUG 92003]|nr:FbpB family small basic protein [Thalassobacillus sp. CUG 92003]